MLANFPHYRYGLFKEIERRLGSVTFVTGESSSAGNIASIPEGTFRCEIRVKNHWIGPGLWQSGVFNALRRSKADAVIFTGNPAYLSTWVNAVMARIQGKRVLFWTIGWHRPEAGLRRRIRLAFYKLANELLVYGNHGREIGISMGFPEDRINVVYNSCESLTESAANTAQPVDRLPNGSRPVIGAVIRLSENKGLEEVVRSVACLRDDHGIIADCLIVGDGPSRSTLEKIASDLGVNLYLPGAMYAQDELAVVYRLLTVTVIPKAAGLTVLQSLAAGTPVVTISDPYQQMPEFEAIEDGVSGTLVSQTDPSSLASACSDWIQRTDEEPNQIIKDCQNAVHERWSTIGQANRMISVISRRRR